MINFTRRTLFGTIASGLCAAALSLPTPASAQDYDLPRVLAMTTYETGTSLNAQATALGNLLKENAGVNLRILPARSDVARVLPLRANRGDFVLTGMSIYNAQEAIDDFMTPDMGPQPLRILLAANGDNGIGMIADPNVGITVPADFAGKRVALIAGSAGLNNIILANLAYGGLTTDDVEIVEFSSYGDAIDGFLAGNVDTTVLVTSSPTGAKVMSSPKEFAWVPLAADDEAAWERAHEVLPFYSSRTVTRSSALAEGETWEGAGYALPALLAMGDKDEETVYQMTKFFYDQFDTFNGTAPATEGFALDRQDFDMLLPYHAGAIRYFREAGVWTDENDAANDEKIARQESLASAWEELMDEGVTGEELASRWAEVRAGL